MSRSILILLMIAVVSLQACKGRGDTAPLPVADTLAQPCDTIPRISVTFIMGRDLSAYNPYYSLANQYYRLNPDERTEVVVDSLTALSQVLDWLRLHPADNGLPYGLVNLVTHGNEFIDLQMTVTPGGSRTSTESLCQAMADSLLLPPDSTVIDRHTLIYLHGCAVGQNQSLLDALAQAFGSSAAVKASKHFEYYAYLSANRNPQSIRHYFARTWYAFYHPDSDYNEAALVQQLRRRYPADTTHWREGRKTPRSSTTIVSSSPVCGMKSMPRLPTCLLSTPAPVVASGWPAMPTSAVSWRVPISRRTISKSNSTAKPISSPTTAWLSASMSGRVPGSSVLSSPSWRKTPQATPSHPFVPSLTTRRSLPFHKTPTSSCPPLFNTSLACPAVRCRLFCSSMNQVSNP